MDTQKMPKWKTFDNLPDVEGLEICTKSGLNVYHGHVHRRPSGILYLGCTNSCDDYALRSLDAWMYPNEFRTLINLCV